MSLTSSHLRGGSMLRSRIAIVIPAVALLATGCATKDWVKQVMGKERTENQERVAKVDQRITEEGQRTSDRLGSETKRIDGLHTRMKDAEDSVEAARGLATSARERADEAHKRSGDVDSRLTRLWNGRHNRSVVDTREVRFGFDRWELTDGAQTELLDVASELKKNAALGVVLEGYADPRGTVPYNIELSRRRVEAVRRYLVGQ